LPENTGYSCGLIHMACGIIDLDEFQSGLNPELVLHQLGERPLEIALGACDLTKTLFRDAEQGLDLPAVVAEFDGSAKQRSGLGTVALEKNVTPRLPSASTLFGSNARIARNSVTARSGWPCRNNSCAWREWESICCCLPEADCERGGDWGKAGGGTANQAQMAA
jgi:hypothetical protein